MKLQLQSMRRFALFMLITVFGSSLSFAQNPVIAAWTFDGLADAPSTSKVIPANVGANMNDANFYADGSNGSSNWLSSASSPELTQFAGADLNDPRATFPSTTQALALANQNANGKSIIFKFSTLGFKDIQWTQANRRTSTGFNSHVYAVSTDGITFTNVETRSYTSTASSFSLYTVNLINQTQLNNQPTVYVRITVSGASAAAGNNRFDNVVFRGVALPNHVINATAATLVTSNSFTANGAVSTADGLGTISVVLDGNIESAATPSSPSAPGVLTNVSSAISGLNPNQSYSYVVKLVTANSEVYTSSAVTVQTLANVPGVLSASNIEATSIGLSVDSATSNNNPANTEFAVRVANQFVQADGTLGDNEYWATSAIWDTVIVLGLTPSTTYSADVKARNADNVETDYGSAISVTTSAATFPYLSASTNSVDFGSVCPMNTVDRSFTISGENLDGTPIEISMLNGLYYYDEMYFDYMPTLSIYYGGNSIENLQVDMRYFPFEYGDNSGSIYITGGGLTSPVEISIAALSQNNAASVELSPAYGVTTSTAVITGNVSFGCTTENVTLYVGTSAGFTIPSAISYTITGGDTNISYNLANLNPETTYYIKAVVGSDLSSVSEEISFTTSKIAAPIALDATAVSTSSFTANWTYVDQATEGYLLEVSSSANFVPNEYASNLIISEYGEGSTGNKKYIEIYNGTGRTVNLADYQIWRATNGANWTFGFALTGTLAHGQAYSIANNNVDVIGANLYNGSLSFNGDDGVALAYRAPGAESFVLIDAFGEENDPGSGWSIAGVSNASVDKILIRKPSVKEPTMNWTLSRGTNSANSQWTIATSSYSSTAQTTNLNLHTMDLATGTLIDGFDPAVVTGATSALVSGLQSGTNYWYRVRAKHPTSTSDYSNIIAVTTISAPASFTGITLVGSPCAGDDATFELSGLAANATSILTYSIGNAASQSVYVEADENGNAEFTLALVASNNGQVLTVTEVERVGGDSMIPQNNNTVTLSVRERITLYADEDGDGYGNSEVSILGCIGTEGYVAVAGDCNDAVAAINPGRSEILYNGIDDNCDGNLDEGNQILSQILPSQCGTTLTSLNSLIQVVSKVQATAYRFRIQKIVSGVPSGDAVILERPYPHFTLELAGIQEYATVFQVEVEVQRNGIWLGYYGTPCQIATPAILDEGGAAAVNPTICNSVLPTISTLIYTTSLRGATAYKFRVTNLNTGNIQELERNLHWFALTMLNSYNYGTDYLIEVAVKTNGAFSGYGSACMISSPAVPMLVNCDVTVATPATYVYTNSMNKATSYRYELTLIGSDDMPMGSTIIDRPMHYFNFNQVVNYTAGGRYMVRVAVMTGGSWSPFGDACYITAPGGARMMASTEEGLNASFGAVVYPNPYSESFAFKFNTTSTEPVQIQIFDMTGRSLLSASYEVNAVEVAEFGNQFPAGVYNVILSQAGQLKALQVIKR